MQTKLLDIIDVNSDVM